MTKRIHSSQSKQPDVSRVASGQREAKPTGVRFYYFYVLLTGAMYFSIAAGVWTAPLRTPAKSSETCTRFRPSAA